jgi:hypothetical protein
MMSTVLVRLASVIVVLTPVTQGQTPPEFQPLYRELETQVANFSALVDSRWNRVKHPVAFSAELLTASADSYYDLLSPANQANVPLEIARLRAIGVKAVTVSVHFPLLYAPFHRIRVCTGSSSISIAVWEC